VAPELHGGTVQSLTSLCRFSFVPVVSGWRWCVLGVCGDSVVRVSDRTRPPFTERDPVKVPPKLAGRKEAGRNMVQVMSSA